MTAARSAEVRLLERLGDELGGEGQERHEHQQEDVEAHHVGVRAARRRKIA